MHPDKHQFSSDPRDTHDNEWTPEGLEEFKHWTEAEANKEKTSPNPYLKEALDKGKAPF